jgi:hypothetical protein
VTEIYQQVRAAIQDGDIALFRNGGLLGRFGTWTHAATCVWFRDLEGEPDTLMLAESREFFGGRVVTLSSQVTDYPGRIDIFRPDCGGELSHVAAMYAARQAGKRYGWSKILLAAVNRLVVLRLTGMWRPNSTDTTPSPWSEPKICSQLVLWSYRMAARALQDSFDLLPTVGDRYCEPSMLPMGRSTLIFQGLKHEGKYATAE